MPAYRGEVAAGSAAKTVGPDSADYRTKSALSWSAGATTVGACNAERNVYARCK